MRFRAIIFDDSSLIRFSLWSIFDGRGYEVFTFPDPGLCPLHTSEKCPCPPETKCADVIISDVKMSGINGLDFVEQLIQKGCKRPPIALMSANFSESDRARAAILGCALFTKPFESAEIVGWIEEVERSISSERALFDWRAPA